MKLEFCRQIFKKSSNTKFHENPSSGSRVVPYGRAYRRADMTEITVAFRKFCERAPKKLIETQFITQAKVSLLLAYFFLQNKFIIELRSQFVNKNLILFQNCSDIPSRFACEWANTCVLISNVFAGNTTLCRGQHAALELWIDRLCR
jgi:hypothetical protein